MAGITHAFTSAKADGADATLVKPSDWNAAHVIGDGTLTIDAASSVATFTLSSGSLVALTLGTTDVSSDFSHVFNVGSSDFGSVQIMGSATNNAGPGLVLYHNSTSPAADDQVGYIDFFGKDSAANAQEYGLIGVSIADPTNASEDSLMNFLVQSGGSLLTTLTLGGSYTPPALYGGGNVFAHLVGLGSTEGWFVVEGSSATALGPVLTFFHDSASPAAADFPGQILFHGRNSAAAAFEYGAFSVQISDTTAGSEDANFAMYVTSAGTEVAALTLGTSNVTQGGLAHVFDVGAGGSAEVALLSTDQSAIGPLYTIYHNSASPAAADQPGGFAIYGNNSAAAPKSYGKMLCSITDATAASEDSVLDFIVRSGGSLTTALSLLGTSAAICPQTIPAGGTAGNGLLMSTTSNFGIFFGSGDPTLSAAKGSIYLRSDGSSASTRMYVNTDGATTWTNFTTAA